MTDGQETANIIDRRAGEDVIRRLELTGAG